MPAGAATAPTSASRRTGDTRFLDPQIIARISNLELVARLIVEGFVVGLHQSPYHGISSEFAAYRKYVPGDPYKFIDWKVLAKTDRLYIKQFEESTNTRVYLVVDASKSMDFGGEKAWPTGTQVFSRAWRALSGGRGRLPPAGEGRRSSGIRKWTYARNLAAALAYLLIRQGDAAGLAVFRDGPPEILPPRGGVVHLHALLSTLAAVAPSGGTDVGKSLVEIPERLARRGLVAVISDLLDETDRILAQLRAIRARRHEVIVFQVLTPEEREFPYRENLEFEDAETGEKLTAQASYIAQAYREALGRHESAIRSFCRQNDIDFVPLSTNQWLSAALVEFIHKRRRVR